MGRMHTHATPVLRRFDDDAPYCFLTFDDGPDAQWTPRVLDALASAGAHARRFNSSSATLKVGKDEAVVTSSAAALRSAKPYACARIG